MMKINPVIFKTVCLKQNIGMPIERYYWFITVFIASVQFILTIIIDIRRKLWIDEIYTLFSARQGNIAEIFQAIVEGCDTSPPLYAMMVHFLLTSINNDGIAVRILSTIGYTSMIIFSAAFFRRIFCAPFALVAVLLITICTYEYSYEGRPYGLALGFAACTLYCWYNCTKNRSVTFSRLLFILSSAIMVSLHFQSISFLGPVLAADIYRRFKEEKVDWNMWLITGFVVVMVLLLHYPVFVTYRRFIRYCWMPALWKYFPAVLPLNMTTKYVYEITAALLLITLFIYKKHIISIASNMIEKHVLIAFVLYFLSPALIFIASVYTTKVFISRYTIWMFIGAAGFIIFLFALVIKNNQNVCTFLVLILTGVVTAIYLKKASEKPFLIGTDEAFKAITETADDTLPLVIADHHIFMELYYYAPERIRRRLVYPLSRELDIEYLGFDSGALLMEACRNRYRLPIVNFNRIAAQKGNYYLLSVPDHYLPSVLEKYGKKPKILKKDAYSALYFIY